MLSNGRFLGLDVGMKRIGVSVSDPLFITAQPVTTIKRQPEASAVAEIRTFCEKYSAKLIVVGLPKHMNGTIGEQAKDVMSFAEVLQSELGVDIVYEDERLSSKSAERYLIEQNKKPSRNKGLVDMASAVIILQQYLSRM